MPESFKTKLSYSICKWSRSVLGLTDFIGAICSVRWQYRTTPLTVVSRCAAGQSTAVGRCDQWPSCQHRGLVGLWLQLIAARAELGPSIDWLDPVTSLRHCIRAQFNTSSRRSVDVDVTPSVTNYCPTATTGCDVRRWRHLSTIDLGVGAPQPWLLGEQREFRYSSVDCMDKLPLSERQTGPLSTVGCACI